MTTVQPPLLLWQIPELEAGPQSAAMPRSAMVADDIEDIDDLPTPVDARADDPPVTDITEDHSAQGYAEGWERGLSEGREQGYSEGIAAATEAAQAAVVEQVRRLAAITARLGGPIAALDAAVEEAVTSLAIEVARCVIGAETCRSRDYLVRLIREAVAKIPVEMGTFKIILNPADQGLIRGLAPEIEDGTVALVGDDGMEPGDCLVIADSQGTLVKDMRWRPRAGEGVSQVDLSLATRWRTVMRELFEGEDK
jgi:flagellar assembly protein FliH